MKIAIVSGEYPPMQGGVGAFSQELGRSLATAGHEIDIITSAHARPPREGRAGNIREAWTRINDLREPIPLEFGNLHPRGRRWRWSDMNLIAELVDRYEYDVVNVQYQAAAYNMRNPAINFLPWRLKGLTRTVVTMHDVKVPYLFPKAGRLRKSIVYRMARAADGCIATNPADHNELASMASIASHALREIPIGSNIATYNPNHVEIEEVREQLNLAENDVLLGYFGFINDSKGADTLVEALTKLGKRYHLVFIGGKMGASDSLNNRLFYDKIEQLISAYKLESRVHWTGFLSDRRVSTYMQLCDLMVLPYKDGASLRRGSLMAALTHGRPTISTVPEIALPDFHHGEAIWLVDPADPDQLAGQIKHLAKDEALRKRIGNAAQLSSQRYNWESIAQETADFFETLL